MTKIPRSRFAAALLALVSMLFMQLALAGYVCPGTTSGQEIAASAKTTALADMPDCRGMDRDQPNLCQAYGQAGDQSLDKPNLPQVQPFIAAALTLVLVEIKLAADGPATAPRDAFLLTRLTAPPLAIRHCCFRI